MHISFNKIDGFVKVYDRVRYMATFDYEWFDKICDRIKCLITEKSGITDSIYHDSIYHNLGKISINLYNFLPIEKFLTC